MYLITYTELHIDDYTEYGGDIERWESTTVEAFDDFYKAFIRFKELDWLKTQDLKLEVFR